MKTPAKEEGNMKLGDWAVIGLKWRTICPHVEEMKQKYDRPPPASTFGWVVFHISLILSPAFTSLRGSAPRVFFRLFAYEKVLKQRTEGKQGNQEGG